MYKAVAKMFFLRSCVAEPVFSWPVPVVIAQPGGYMINRRNYGSRTSRVNTRRAEQRASKSILPAAHLF